MKWSKVYVWAVVTSSPCNRVKGCLCHQSFDNGHPGNPSIPLDESIYGPVAPTYVSWNQRCPWHGHSDSEGEFAGDEIWIAAWEKKIEETKGSFPNFLKFIECLP